MKLSWRTWTGRWFIWFVTSLSAISPGKSGSQPHQGNLHIVDVVINLKVAGLGTPCSDHSHRSTGPVLSGPCQPQGGRRFLQGSSRIQSNSYIIYQGTPRCVLKPERRCIYVNVALYVPKGHAVGCVGLDTHGGLTRSVRTSSCPATGTEPPKAPQASTDSTRGVHRHGGLDLLAHGGAARRLRRP